MLQTQPLPTAVKKPVSQLSAQHPPGWTLPLSRLAAAWLLIEVAASDPESMMDTVRLKLVQR